MRIHRFIIALLCMTPPLCGRHIPAEVLPLVQTLTASADITVIDTVPLGQSLAAQRVQLESSSMLGEVINNHQILRQMLGVITIYVAEQHEWLPPSFVRSWHQLLQSSLSHFPLGARGTQQTDLSKTIHEVVTAVSGAAKAVVGAVHACMKLLQEVRSYLTTRSPQLRAASSSKKNTKRTRALASIAGCCGAAALLFGIWLVRRAPKKEFSSHQHRDIVPTTDAGRAGRTVPRVMATTNEVVDRPAVPTRPATPNQSNIPRCLQHLVTMQDGHILANSACHERLVALQKLIPRILSTPSVLASWFHDLFAQRDITLQQSHINKSFKGVIAKLFFSKRQKSRVSLFTKALVARCAWALRQLVATGTPTPTCSRPVATITEPAAKPITELRNDHDLLHEWHALFGQQEDAFYEAYLFLTSRAVQAVRERVGIASPPAEIAQRLAEEVVTQFLDATTRMLNSTNVRAAERHVAEHIFVCLQRYERCWAPLVPEHE